MIKDSLLLEKDNHFIINKLSGYEQISRIFSFHIELKKTAPSYSLLNKNVTISLRNGKYRKNIKAVVAAEDFCGQKKIIQAVSPLCLLSHVSGNAGYSSISIPKLIKKILEKNYGCQLECFFDLTNTYPEVELVTQSNESYLNFIERLLAQEGMYYYFDHDHNSRLVISDRKVKANSNKYFTHVDGDLEIISCGNEPHKVIFRNWDLRTKLAQRLVVGKRCVNVQEIIYNKETGSACRLTVQAGTLGRWDKNRDCHFAHGPIHASVCNLSDNEAADEFGRYGVNLFEKSTVFPLRSAYPQMADSCGFSFYLSDQTPVILDSKHTGTSFINSSIPNGQNLNKNIQVPALSHQIRTPFGGQFLMTDSMPFPTLKIDQEDVSQYVFDGCSIKRKAVNLVEIRELYSISNNFGTIHNLSGGQNLTCAGIQMFLATGLNIDATFGPYVDIHPRLHFIISRKTRCQFRVSAYNRLKRIKTCLESQRLAVNESIVCEEETQATDEMQVRYENRYMKALKDIKDAKQATVSQSFCERLRLMDGYAVFAPYVVSVVKEQISENSSFTFERLENAIKGQESEPVLDNFFREVNRKINKDLNKKKQRTMPFIEMSKRVEIWSPRVKAKLEQPQNPLGQNPLLQNPLLIATEKRIRGYEDFSSESKEYYFQQNMLFDEIDEIRSQNSTHIG